MVACVLYLYRNTTAGGSKQLFQRSFSLLCPSSFGAKPKKISLDLDQTKRNNFSFAGPRKLDEILKTELIKDKSKAEVSDLWMTYHESKENVFGSVIPKDKGEIILRRASEW